MGSKTPRRLRDKNVSQSVGTKVVHAGEDQASAFGAVGTPIIQSSTFLFDDNKDLEAYLAGESDRHLYSRWSNPTVSVAEAKLAALENAEGALAFSSGMAAITTAVLSFVKSGDRILALDSIYGGTYEFFSHLCPRWGIEVTWSSAEDLARLVAETTPAPSLVYFESPTNPNLKVVDIQAVTEQARKRGIPVIMDNTFATPILQQPIGLGVDVVVHSATKYLAGHSDLICGLMAGSSEHLKKAWELRKLLGGVLNAGSASLLVRGMKTLELRVMRQSQNAQKLAESLAGHPAVEKVDYPGLPDSGYHQIARKQMSAYTGMLAFTVKGGLEAARRVTDRLKLILYAPSLGGVESVASLPVRTSHLHYSPEDLERAGVTQGMIRISCGIESADDLIADTKQALA
jgi:cystathionine beta-lyase/cystathionine gamma-synthase